MLALICSTGADATIRIWDLNTEKCLKVMEGHLAGISALDWSPDGKTIASGADDKVIWLWNVSTVVSSALALALAPAVPVVEQVADPSLRRANRTRNLYSAMPTTSTPLPFPPKATCSCPAHTTRPS